MIRVILIFFFIFVVMTIFFYGWQFLKNLQIEPGPPGTFFKAGGSATQKETQEVKPVIKSAEPNLIIKSPEPETTISLDTLIISGPQEGEVIEETNEVTFEFEAGVLPEKLRSEVFFETRIEELETGWQSTFSNKRILRFPPGPKEYKFLVRAKIGDSVDLTPASRTFKINTSPFFGKVKIYNISAQTTYNPSKITLSSQMSQGEKINITNWRIRGKRGTIIIPQAIEVYPPSYDPSANKDVLIGQGEIVYLISNPNPLDKKQNFRFNKCLGYLEKSLVSFFGSCPQPNKLEQISYLDEYCQEFILNIRPCEVPDYSKNIKILFDMECRDYIDENFNYQGCFRNYSRDEDFLDNRWYIYSSYDIVSKLHDTLYLRDQNGLLVDKYLY